jgi:hypothetical protein
VTTEGLNAVRGGDIHLGQANEVLVKLSCPKTPNFVPVVDARTDGVHRSSNAEVARSSQARAAGLTKSD